jgi:hypothetical protein
MSELVTVLGNFSAIGIVAQSDDANYDKNDIKELQRTKANHENQK